MAGVAESSHPGHEMIVRNGVSVMNVSIATRRNARIDGLESALAILALLSIAALLRAAHPATQARGAET